MGAVVGPHAPIVVGLALGIFAVLVVEESDHLIHHRYGDRQPRAKDRPRELQREIGADAVPFQEIAQISVGLGARKVVERDPPIDTGIDSLPLDSLELGSGQPLIGFQVAVEKQVVARDRDPIHTLEPTIDANPDAVLRIVETGRRHPAAAQLRVRRVILPAGPLELVLSGKRSTGRRSISGSLASVSK